MTVEEKIASLEEAWKKAKNALALIGLAWGDSVEERQANVTAYARIADANGLLDRAAQKLRKAIELLSKPGPETTKE